MIKKKDVTKEVFNDIRSGLNEVLEWTKGKTKAHITLPGKKAEMMTKGEYDKEKGK